MSQKKQLLNPLLPTTKNVNNNLDEKVAKPLSGLATFYILNFSISKIGPFPLLMDILF